MVNFYVILNWKTFLKNIETLRSGIFKPGIDRLWQECKVFSKGMKPVGYIKTLKIYILVVQIY